MDVLVVHTMGMGHDQFNIVTAVRDKRVDQQGALLVPEHSCRFLQELRVGPGVPGKTSHIRLYNGNRGFGHKIITL